MPVCRSCKGSSILQTGSISRGLYVDCDQRALNFSTIMSLNSSVVQSTIDHDCLHARMPVRAVPSRGSLSLHRHRQVLPRLACIPCWAAQFSQTRELQCLSQGASHSLTHAPAAPSPYSCYSLQLREPGAPACIRVCALNRHYLHRALLTSQALPVSLPLSSPQLHG